MAPPRSILQFLHRAVARTVPSRTAQTRLASYQRFPQRGGRLAPPYQRQGAYEEYSRFRPYARAQYVWRNYRPAVVAVGAGGTVFYVYNLEETPVTHRRRFNYISPDIEKAGSSSALQQILEQYRSKILPTNHPYTQTVARIVERLLPSAHGLGGNEWQVFVIDDPEMVNAFVLPGGKVFVFTGLFPIAKDENGLAAVLGHEIGHNVAHHVAERMSRAGPLALLINLAAIVTQTDASIGNAVAQLAVELPNGRTQETEADHIGLLMMAESCYDPRRVPDLWKRMHESEGKHGGAPPQFLSTHPSSSSRGDTIAKWMPEAMDLYSQNDCARTSVNLNEFKSLTGMATSIRDGLAMAFPRGIGREVKGRDSDDWF